MKIWRVSVPCMAYFDVRADTSEQAKVAAMEAYKNGEDPDELEALDDPSDVKLKEK